MISGSDQGVISGWMAGHEAVSIAAEQSGHVYEAAAGGFETESDSGDRRQVRRKEVIGPYQTKATGWWFGNNFYDAEGWGGTLGISMRRHAYQLFSPGKWLL